MTMRLQHSDIIWITHQGWCGINRLVAVIKKKEEMAQEMFRVANAVESSNEIPDFVQLNDPE